MTARPHAGWQDVFAASAGLFLGLGLLKFGNPILLDHLIAPPADAFELAFQSWPTAWMYPGLAALGVAGVLATRREPLRHWWDFLWPLGWLVWLYWPPSLRVGFWGFPLVAALGALASVATRRETPRPRWLVALPLLWLAWQFLAGSQTVDIRLTRPTLVHFTAVVAGFYCGVFALAPVRRMGLFWGGILVGFTFVLWTGFDQHFGGLEATRRFVYSQPDWEKLAPEYLKRIASNRIFATLLYPNALAGVILLLLPPLLVAAWRMAVRLTHPTRCFIVAVLAGCGLACLYWSGSKAGWLIALVMSVTALLHLKLARRWRWALVVLLLAGGLAGFAARFAGYFERGATSVSARGDYWRAAWRTFRERPVFGSGPGTFAISYRRIKPPEAEMARLAHNDYLEQASDSGAIGFLSYTAFLLGSLIVLHRRAKEESRRFAVWLGLSGWAMQSGVEFGLYIPAVGGTAFWLLGWLWGNQDPPPPAHNGDSRDRATDRRS